MTEVYILLMAMLLGQNVIHIPADSTVSNGYFGSWLRIIFNKPIIDQNVSFDDRGLQIKSVIIKLFCFFSTKHIL